MGGVKNLRNLGHLGSFIRKNLVNARRTPTLCNQMEMESNNQSDRFNS